MRSPCGTPAGGRSSASLPHGFIAINATSIFGLPITALLRARRSRSCCGSSRERLPLGPHLYAIGANPKAAALNGIPVRAYVIGVFVASGAARPPSPACVLASKLRIGQASVGLEYLLPALVGAFLGSTTIKPGRVNVWGTMVGVLILAVGISGIQQFGGAFFVEPLFNGVTLLVAIGSPATRSAGARSAKPARGRSKRADEFAGRPPGTSKYRRPPAVAHAGDTGLTGRAACQ